MSEKSFSKYDLIKPLIIGLLVSIISSLLLMLVCAIAVTNLDLDESEILVLSITSMAVGAFLDGLTSAKLFKKKGFLVGALGGLIFFFLITFISFALSASPVSAVSLIKLITFVLCSTLGGIVGVNTAKKRKI